jgi:hypothetical protein
VFWDIYDSTNTTMIGQSTFHLSCSDIDMNSADDCGKTEGNAKGSVGCFPGGTNADCVNAWTFDGMAGGGKTLDCANPNGVGKATYHYTVTNNGDAPVTFKLTDAVTTGGVTETVDVFAGTDTVTKGTPKTYTMVDTISGDTTDIATASPDPACGKTFDSNPVTVTLAAGGGGGVGACPTGGALTIKDREVKWALTDPKDGVKHVIKEIIVTWPDATNGALTEVKLGRPKIFKGSLFPSPQTINSFNGKAHDRELNDGHKEDLKFKFVNNAAAGPYDITVNFEGTCSVHIVKP